MPRQSTQDISSSLNRLSLSSPSSNPSPAHSRKQQQQVADSWDDEASDSDAPREVSSSPSKAKAIPDYPSAPPPTPATASQTTHSRPAPIHELPDFASSFSFSSASRGTPASSTRRTGGAREGGADVRPEKTTASAARMIAGALGVRAPKRTEEQRAYDKAVREKESRRREREKEEKRAEERERERARAAVWDD